MDLGLTGKVAVVLGSTSGLGRASRRGARRRGCPRRRRRAPQGARRRAGRRRCRRRVGVVADLTDPDAPGHASSRPRREAFGPVDVLVLNGGGPPPGTADRLDRRRRPAAADLLLTPHVAWSGEVLPGMRERGWGRILADRLQRRAAADPDADRVERRPRRAGGVPQDARWRRSPRDGVTVNMVLPGRIDTDRVASLDARGGRAHRQGRREVARRVRGHDPRRSLRRARRSSASVVDLPRRRSRPAYVTGEQVRCDGGLVARATDPPPPPP